MAIGATRGQILGLVLTQAGRPVALGAVLGVAAAVVTNRLLQAAFVNASSTDSLTYTGTLLVLLVFAAVGCAVPACRAMRIDPVVALRSE